MYKLNCENGFINILYKKNIVLEKIYPKILFSDKSSINLIYNETKFEKINDFENYIFNYIDSNNKYNLDVLVKTKENLLSFFIKFESKTSVFNQTKELDSEKGIYLEVKDIKKIEGLVANYLYSEWWTRPHFDKNIKLLPSRTQSLLWKKNNFYNYIIPVCDKNNKTEINGSDYGFEIITSSKDSGYNYSESKLFTLGTSRNPYKLIENCVKFSIKDLENKILNRKERKYPEVFEYLGWCTWDAFYKELSAEKIIQKMNEFKKLEIPIKWIIIDDGWLKTEDNCLLSFKEDLNKFPDGLKNVIDKLKNDFDVNWIGIWHTIVGYWEGIKYNSDVYNENKELLIQTKSNRFIPNVSNKNIFEFFSRWYDYLKQQGIDFVKVDGQSNLYNITKNNISIGELSDKYHNSLEEASSKYFSNVIINCMGMATENIFNRPKSAISRNSDDFFPNVKNYFREHFIQNVYNSLYHGQFYHLDYDMWWSNHEDNKNHSILRALSGGPIYISDKINETNRDAILPLVLSDGKILRCDEVGLPTEDILFKNPIKEECLAKIWNKVNDFGVIALFNINEEENEIKGKIKAIDIPDFKEGNYLIYDYFDEEIYIKEYDEEIQVKLEKNESKLFFITPYKEIIVFGNVNKFIFPATVKSSEILGKKLIVKLKEGGIFSFYSELKASIIKCNSDEVKFSNIKNMYKLDCSKYLKEVLIELEFE